MPKLYAEQITRGVEMGPTMPGLFRMRFNKNIALFAALNKTHFKILIREVPEDGVNIPAEEAVEGMFRAENDVFVATEYMGYFDRDVADVPTADNEIVDRKDFEILEFDPDDDGIMEVVDKPVDIVPEDTVIVKNEFGYSGEPDLNIEPFQELTNDQKIKYNWDANLEKFKEINAGVGPETLKQWFRKALRQGWTEQDPIPNIRDINVTFLEGSDIPVIEAYSFDDAFAYAWTHYGKGRMFHWKRKISGSLLKNRKVSFGSEARQYNDKHHVYTDELADMIYRVSGDKELYDKVVADPRITEDFTLLVKDAQKVIFYDDPTMWTGKLDDITMSAITVFRNMTPKEQDTWTVTSHYFFMKKINEDNRDAVMTEVFRSPEAQDLYAKQIQLFVMVNNHKMFGAYTTGTPGVNPQAWLDKKNAEYNAEVELEKEVQSLSLQVATMIRNGLIAAGYQSDDAVLNAAMDKYSIIGREQGWTYTVFHPAMPAMEIPASDSYGTGSGMGIVSSTAVYTPGKSLPASPAYTQTVDYREELRQSVRQREHDIQQQKMEEAIELSISNESTPYQELIGELSMLDVINLKEAARILGGDDAALYDEWVRLQGMLLTIPAETETLPEQLSLDLDAFHERIVNYYNTVVGTEMPLDAEEWFANTNVTFISEADKKTTILEKDARRLITIFRRKLGQNGSSEATTLRDNWNEADKYKAAFIDAQTGVINGKLVNFTYFDVRFIEEGYTSDYVDPTQKTTTAPGSTLPAFWTKEGDEYIVRVLINPGGETPYYTLTGYSMYSALEKLNTHNDFPNGELRFHNDKGAQEKVYVRNHTPTSETLGWISLGLGILSIVLIPFTGGGSLALNLLATSAWVGSAAFGIASSVAHMYEHSQTGSLTTDMIVTDIANAIASAVPGVGGASRLLKVVKVVDKALEGYKYFVPIMKGVDYAAMAINAYYFGEDIYQALLEIEKIEDPVKRRDATYRLIMFSLITGFAIVSPMIMGGSRNFKKNKLFGVDDAMKADDEAAGILINGEYLKNPTATRVDDLIVNPSGTVKGKLRLDPSESTFQLMDGKYMYVIDEQGSLIIGTRAKGFEAPFDAGKAPHPTLIGGADPKVQAAGIVEFRGGKIYKVDNSSGHFKPDAESLDITESIFMSKFQSKSFTTDFQGFNTFQ